jgi:hypothetical protein
MVSEKTKKDPCAKRSPQFHSISIYVRCLIKGHVSDDGIKPNTSGQFQIGRAPIHPRANRGRFERRGTEQARIGAKARDKTRRGATATNQSATFTRAAIFGLHVQNGQFVHRRLLDNGFGIGRVDVDGNAIVFGGNQDRKGAKGGFRREQGIDWTRHVALLLLLLLTERDNERVIKKVTAVGSTKAKAMRDDVCRGGESFSEVS